MKKLIIAAALAVFAAAAQADEAPKLLYSCSDSVLYETAVVLLYDSAVESFDTQQPAHVYQDGLNKRWVFGPDGLHAIVLTPGGDAGYYVFPDEKAQVRPRATMYCRSAD